MVIELITVIVDGLIVCVSCGVEGDEIDAGEKNVEKGTQPVGGGSEVSGSSVVF